MLDGSRTCAESFFHRSRFHKRVRVAASPAKVSHFLPLSASKTIRFLLTQRAEKRKVRALRNALSPAVFLSINYRPC